MEDRAGRIFLAMLLIVVGLFFSIVAYFPGLLELEYWWPSFILLPGAAMLAASLVGVFGKSRGLAGMAIPGCVVTAVGLVLLFGNVTGHWEVWAYAWTLIPASAGLGLLLASRSGDTHAGGSSAGRWLFAGGLAGFVLLGMFFEGLVFHGWASRLWPAVLILGGLAILLSDRVRRGRL